MNTTEIDRILFSQKRTKRLFLGTFPSDQLPEQLPREFLLCSNIQTSKEPGSHWVALARLHGKVYYFDSFGKPPPKRGGLAKFCSRFNGIYFNNISHQRKDADTCGGYVIFVLTMLAHGHSFREIIQLFKATRHDDSLIAIYCGRYGVQLHSHA